MRYFVHYGNEPWSDESSEMWWNVVDRETSETVCKCYEEKWANDIALLLSEEIIDRYKFPTYNPS